jgi:hypothetical protein
LFSSWIFTRPDENKSGTCGIGKFDESGFYLDKHLKILIAKESCSLRRDTHG